MPRSMHAVGFAVIVLLSCAKSSESQPVVTAPVGASLPGDAAAQAAPQAASAPAASASAPAGSVSTGFAATAPSGVAAAGDDGGTAQFRACQQDSDCVAVPRVGCCHNGHMEAVNVSQKDAYAQSFTCPHPRPCPMYMIRDRRLPKCDPAAKLCVMVMPPPTP
jgi:hypothetical protein